MHVPDSPLLDDEQQAFVRSVLAFASDRLDDTALAVRDTSGEFWHEGWSRLAGFGLCGLPAPTEHDGGGADRVTTAAALDALGYGCSDAGLVFSLNAHLWSAVVPLWHFGDAEQQARYLGPLCRGESIGLHAMTEPDSGSDAFALRTTATSTDGGFVLRGRKTLITNAPVADVAVVFARTPGTEGVLGITAFVLRTDHPGLSVEHPIDKLGLRTSPMSEIVLDDVEVDRSAILGPPGRGAQIFATSMEWERSLIMAAALGALARSLDEAITHARERRQFGQPISSFGAVASRLVDTRTALDAARALVYQHALALDRGATGSRAAALAATSKLTATRAVVDGTAALLENAGGHGFTTDLPYARRLRDALGALAYSGTSDMMRMLVGRDMGL